MSIVHTDCDVITVMRIGLSASAETVMHRMQRIQMCCGLHRVQRYQRLCDACSSSAEKKTLVMLQANFLDFTAAERNFSYFATFAQLSSNNMCKGYSLFLKCLYTVCLLTVQQQVYAASNPCSPTQPSQ